MNLTLTMFLSPFGHIKMNTVEQLATIKLKETGWLFIIIILHSVFVSNILSDISPFPFPSLSKCTANTPTQQWRYSWLETVSVWPRECGLSFYTCHHLKQEALLFNLLIFRETLFRIPSRFTSAQPPAQSAWITSVKQSSHVTMTTQTRE